MGEALPTTDRSVSGLLGRGSVGAFVVGPRQSITRGSTRAAACVGVEVDKSGTAAA